MPSSGPQKPTSLASLAQSKGDEASLLKDDKLQGTNQRKVLVSIRGNSISAVTNITMASILENSKTLSDLQKVYELDTRGTRESKTPRKFEAALTAALVSSATVDYVPSQEFNESVKTDGYTELKKEDWDSIMGRTEKQKEQGGSATAARAASSQTSAAGCKKGSQAGAVSTARSTGLAKSTHGTAQESSGVVKTRDGEDWVMGGMEYPPRSFDDNDVQMSDAALYTMGMSSDGGHKDEAEDVGKVEKPDVEMGGMY